MSQNTKRFLFWSPRIFCIAFAIFLALFALDVFNEHLGFWGTLLALVMHMKWPASVIAVLALAWQWEWVGAVLFATLGFYYDSSVHGHLDWKMVISGPLFLLALLFLVNWLKHAELHQPAPNR